MSGCDCDVEVVVTSADADEEDRDVAVVVLDMFWFMLLDELKPNTLVVALNARRAVARTIPVHVTFGPDRSGGISLPLVPGLKL